MKVFQVYSAHDHTRQFFDDWTDALNCLWRKRGELHTAECVRRRQPDYCTCTDERLCYRHAELTEMKPHGLYTCVLARRVMIFYTEVA